MQGVNKKDIVQKIFHFPLTKIIIGLVICGAVAGVGHVLIQKIVDLTSLGEDLKLNCRNLCLYACYSSLYQFI